jgi:hypothetical protein
MVFDLGVVVVVGELRDHNACGAAGLSRHGWRKASVTVLPQPCPFCILLQKRAASNQLAYVIGLLALPATTS